MADIHIHVCSFFLAHCLGGLFDFIQYRFVPFFRVLYAYISLSLSLSLSLFSLGMRRYAQEY